MRKTKKENKRKVVVNTRNNFRVGNSKISGKSVKKMKSILQVNGIYT